MGSALNHLLSLFVPISIFVLVGCIQRSLHLIHHGAIGLCAARYGVSILFNASSKFEINSHITQQSFPTYHGSTEAQCWFVHLLIFFLYGAQLMFRPRPVASRLFSQMQMGRNPVGMHRVCSPFLGTGTLFSQKNKGVREKQMIVDGRKSFPSGHSSTAFSGMFFLSLWTAGQTAAWCFNVQMPPRSLRSSRMTSFFLSLLPLFWATHVAVTRIQDHVSDFSM